MNTRTVEPHHHSSRASQIMSELREIMFGLGDGLVSTLGTITGIAGATYNSFFVILSGLVLVAVEALSMSVGEYLSSKSETELWQKRMDEERKEIKEEPERERVELEGFYREKGLPERDVQYVTNLVAKRPDWVLEEMAVHELKMSPVAPTSPLRGAFFMLFFYIAGGLVPILPYFFLTVHEGILPSVVVTAGALFVIGGVKARYTTGKWIKGGFEMMLLSLAAAAIGYEVGQLVAQFQR